MNPTITLKELASKIGVSTWTVKRKEAKWGLDKFRSPASDYPLWFRPEASKLLLSKGIIRRPL
jgi:hypothetical protein